MRNIVNIAFIIILVVFSISLILNTNSFKNDEIIQSTINSTLIDASTKELEDGTIVLTETYTDGTVVVTETKKNGEKRITTTTPESYGINEGQCPVIYTVEDNKWFIEQSESNKITNDVAPSYEKNVASGCWDSKDQIMQLANGTYSNNQISSNDNAFFYLINENDVVEITVNGVKYVLDANNPTLELQLEVGDEVIINSSNSLGVYYDTETGLMDSSAKVTVVEE